MIFYKTKKWDYAKVEAVECESETAKFVVIKGRRNAKRSDYENYFPSELEAWQFLIAQYKSSCDYHKRELHKYNTALGQCAAAAKKVEAAQTSYNTASPTLETSGVA